MLVQFRFFCACQVSAGLLFRSLFGGVNRMWGLKRSSQLCFFNTLLCFLTKVQLSWTKSQFFLVRTAKTVMLMEMAKVFTRESYIVPALKVLEMLDKNCTGTSKS